MTSRSDKLHLLGPKGEEALAKAMRLGPLVAFDFDGTLAPLASRRDAVRVSIVLARRLELLSRVLPVAVITGRSVADVAPRLGFKPRFLIGNHGAEDPDTTPSSRSGELEPLRAHLRRHGDGLRKIGVEIEDKGYSIALHYRLAPNRSQAVQAIESMLSGLEESTKVFGGKCVVNVVANDAPDKADALDGLVRRCGSPIAIFVGDDVNDEVVFTRAPPEWLTVRVGRDDAGSQARYFLESISEVGMMLHRMVDLAASG